MTERELPGHIGALLQRSGSLADTAGVPWEGRDLSAEGNPLHTFDGDDGSAPDQLVSARRRLIAGEIDEAGLINALPGLRLFAPVIATASGVAADGADKEADISLVSLTSAAGRKTMPVFSSVTALTRWHAEARPVAAETERVMLAALAEEAELVVLDPGAELPVVIRRPALEALAQGARWTPSYQDAELAAALAEVPELSPGVEALQLGPARGILTTTAQGETVVGGGSGPELSIGVVLESGLDQAAQRLALAAVQTALDEIELLHRRADSVEITRAGPRH